jgi:hypothetical protein
VDMDGRDRPGVGAVLPCCSHTCTRYTYTHTLSCTASYWRAPRGSGDTGSAGCQQNHNPKRLRLGICVPHSPWAFKWGVAFHTALCIAAWLGLSPVMGVAVNPDARGGCLETGLALVQTQPRVLLSIAAHTGNLWGPHPPPPHPPSLHLFRSPTNSAFAISHQNRGCVCVHRPFTLLATSTNQCLCVCALWNLRNGKQAAPSAPSSPALPPPVEGDAPGAIVAYVGDNDTGEQPQAGYVRRWLHCHHDVSMFIAPQSLLYCLFLDVVNTATHGLCCFTAAPVTGICVPWLPILVAWLGPCVWPLAGYSVGSVSNWVVNWDASTLCACTRRRPLGSLIHAFEAKDAESDAVDVVHEKAVGGKVRACMHSDCAWAQWETLTEYPRSAAWCSLASSVVQP